MSLALFQGDSITVLTPEAPVTVRVTADSPTLLRYTAPNAQVVSIFASVLDDTDTLDPTLELFDTSGRRIAYADDVINRTTGEVDRSAQIDSVPIEAGEYIIAVDSFNGVSEGEVRVSVMRMSSEGTLLGNDYALTDYAFNLWGWEPHTAALSDYIGQTVILSVWDPFSNLDPVIEVLDADGQIIARNDDHQGGPLMLGLFGARLEPFTLTKGMTVRAYDALGRPGGLMMRIEVIP